MEGPDNRAFDEWLLQPIPQMPPLEEGMTYKNIHAESAGLFDPVALTEYLKEHEGDEVLAIEVGGKTVRAAVCTVGSNGTYALRSLTEEEFPLPPMEEAEDGTGYLDYLKAYAQFAKDHNLPVGIAFAGPLEGTKPLEHPKISNFIEDLRRDHKGDLQDVFKDVELVVEHDGVAALVRSVMEFVENGSENSEVICLINGGGLGLAVFDGKELHRTEVGHYRVIAELNVNGVATSCGVYEIDGKSYICLENTVANGKGVVPQWEAELERRQPGWRAANPDKQLTGVDVEEAARNHDPFALQLFEQVALAEATILKAVARVFGIDFNRLKAALHGGMHRTPMLQERIERILSEDQDLEQELLFTEDIEKNVCLSGIALYLFEQRRQAEAASAEQESDASTLNPAPALR